MKSAPCIAFDYSPSQSAMVACLGIATLAETAVFCCGLNWLLKILLAITILAYAVIEIRRYRHPSYRRIMWHSAGHWRLIDNHGQEVEADLVGSARIGPMMVLSLAPFEASCFRAVILPDNLNAELRRCLRVRLNRRGTR